MLVKIAALFFLLGITSISYHQVGFSLLFFLGLVTSMFIINKEKRFVISLLFSFLVGFVVFIVSSDFVKTMNIAIEIKVILNRLFLVFIIIAVVINPLVFKKKVSWYNEKPNWKNPIVLPYHNINTFWFWLIGIVVNGIIYLFFILQKDMDQIQMMFLFCLFFSLINAVFEEVIWRGIMLSSLKEHTSTGYAVSVTSVGFGLLHLSIGFPIGLSLLTSIAGVIFAIITLKTNSIYPGIVFHIVTNIGMVFSGFII